MSVRELAALELRRCITSDGRNDETRRSVDGHEDLGILGSGVLDALVGHVDGKVVLQEQVIVSLRSSRGEGDSK